MNKTTLEVKNTKWTNDALKNLKATMNKTVNNFIIKLSWR